MIKHSCCLCFLTAAVSGGVEVGDSDEEDSNDSDISGSSEESDD